MRASWLVSCLFWIGCLPSGVALEVTTTDRSIQHIELFVGGACDEGSCPATVAPPGLAARPSDIYLVSDPQPWSETVRDGSAIFQLRADEDTSVPLIVAVGFDAVDGTARAVAVVHDVPVSSSDAVHWQLPLVPATRLDDTLSMRERVGVWRQPTEPGLACVMVEHADGKRELIVPKDDTDCDQVARECAPWTNLAVDAPSTIGAASCLLMESTGSGVCMLGGPTCSEIPAPTSACDVLDTPYCAPSGLCMCGPWNEGCVRDQIALSTSMPMIRCEVPLKLDGAPCDGSSELHVPVAADAFVASSTTTCVNALLNDVATPLGAFERSVSIGGAMLGVERVGDRCGLELVYTGKLATSLTAPLLVDLALDNHNHLVVPLRIRFIGGGCDDVGPLCSVTSIADSMFKCAGQMPSASLCAAQPGSGCGGPSCGSGCCKTGEQCVNGACRCGSLPGCDSGLECAAGSTTLGCGSKCCGGTSGILCEF